MSLQLLRALAGSILFVVGAGAAAAQEPAGSFPSRNITLVVPQQAGSNPDIVARLIATPLQDRLGKAVVVENRPGASASLGATGVARAPPDGYTLLFTDMTVALAPALLAKPGFDPVKNLTPVVLAARSYMILTVNPGLPAKTLAEFVALAKAKPGEIKYGSPGIGSPPHLAALAFLEATGAEILHVPYRGSPAAITDIVGGHIQMIFNSPGSVMSQVESGALRLLAVSGPVRMPKAPDVPTFREAKIDMKGVEEGAWFGITAPTGTPRDIIMKLNAQINAVLKEPDTRQKLERDYSIEGGAPEIFGKMIEQQTAYWAGALQRSGVKPAAQ